LKHNSCILENELNGSGWKKNSFLWRKKNCLTLWKLIPPPLLPAAYECPWAFLSQKLTFCPNCSSSSVCHVIWFQAGVTKIIGDPSIHVRFSQKIGHTYCITASIFFLSLCLDVKTMAKCLDDTKWNHDAFIYMYYLAEYKICQEGRYLN